MLNFGLLSRLYSHNEWLHGQLQTENFWLVGGVVRDLLLGIDKPLIDIDITGPHHPDTRRDTMKSDSGVSRFRTEKFGTMTIVRVGSKSHILEQINTLRGFNLLDNNINFYDPNYPQQEGLESVDKNMVLIILKNNITEKFGLIQWHGVQDKLFIGGEIEDGEKPNDAALREAMEESGVLNIKTIVELGSSIKAHFYHPKKNINLCATNYIFYASTDDSQNLLSNHELNTLSFEWYDKNEISKYINVGTHALAWNRYLKFEAGFSLDKKFDTEFINNRNKNFLNTQQFSVSYEITPFRCEGEYEDFRHPGEIQWSDSLLDDAKRRDFTINCLYYRRIKNNDLSQESQELSNISPNIFDTDKYIKQGYRYDEASKTLCICDHELIIKVEHAKNTQEIEKELGSTISNVGNVTHLIIDPYQGLVDLVLGTLRCVGDADHRFQEDALRILRALRFVNTLNQTPPRGDTLLLSQIQWDFHRDTRRSMQKYHFLVQHLAKERIHQELVKVFKMNNPFGYVALLDELKLLSLIFPALAAIKGLEQPVRYHPLDTYHHTLMTLWHLQKINSNYLVKLAMLYHDVGKSQQYKLYNIGLTREEMGIVHGSWLNHTVCGPDFVRKDFAALGFSSIEIDTVARLVQYHMYPGQILMSTPDNQIKKLRKLLAESSYEQMQNLLDVMEGDRLGHYNPLQSQAELAGPQDLRNMLDKIYHDEGQITMSSLEIDGSILMSELKITPGKIIGKLIQKCLDYVLIDPTRNTRKELLSFAKKECKKLESSISSQ